MTFHEAYLGKRLQDLLTLSHQQMQLVYKARGLVIPVEGSSTLHALSPGARFALSDLARHLDQPHQLVAQRLQKLVKLKLVCPEADPNDRRRTEYVLTSIGKKQWRVLDELMADAVAVNQGLFKEINVDLIRALEDAIEAISNKSFAERFSAHCDNSSASTKPERAKA